MITYSDVEVRFGDFVAIPDLNLTIEDGEFFTLLGPSGCGKTTILRALAGFVSPSRGTISIAGRDVTRLPSDKRDIGMVFQNYALFPSMTVRDNIAFGLTVAKVAKAEREERVERIAREVDLKPAQLERGVAELSGGQQQRVAIARAMVMRPTIMLLDEPLSNLDAKLRHQMRVQLKELQTHFGITCVYVTHDQDEALALSDRIAVLDGGRIEQVGAPREVYQRSATEFVCTFIGDVNRLAPHLTGCLVDGGATGLDATLAAFVRIEKVGLLPPGASLPTGRVGLPGTVVTSAYHGLHSTYEVQVGDAVLKAVVPEDGTTHDFDPGQSVTVAVDTRTVLQYPPQTEAAA